MSDQILIQEKLGALKQAAPAGYALAFHIEFTTPTFLFQTYPSAWNRQYSENGLVMSDPTVHWGFENEGTIRWSALEASDKAGVLKQAAEHGLNYGLTCSVTTNAARSFASFSLSDREFSDAEAATLMATVQELHELTAQLKSLSPQVTAALQKMAVDVTPSSS